jgi:hypothetical protein
MALKDKTGKVLSRSEGEAVMKGRGAVTISIYALLLAICTLLGNGNSSKVLSNTLSASETWAYYQAKSIKQSLAQMAIDDMEIETNNPGKLQRYKSNVVRYDQEQKEIMAKARKHEAERDYYKAKGPYFSIANTLLQISIVLSSTSILAVSMPLLWASVIVGSIGSLILSAGIWGWFTLWFL